MFNTPTTTQANQGQDNNKNPGQGAGRDQNDKGYQETEKGSQTDRTGGQTNR